MLENFESDSLNLNFTGDWDLSTNQPYSGTKCYKSKPIAIGETSSCQFTYTTGKTPGYCELYYRVDSSKAMAFKIYVDGQLWYTCYAVDQKWAKYACSFSPETTHVFKFEYTKVDGSNADDAAYIDNILIFDLMTENAYVDTLRILHTDLSVKFSADLKRTVSKTDVFSADLKRIIQKSEAFSVDLKRVVSASLAIVAEMIRRIPVVLNLNNVPVKKAPTGVKSVAITMESKTLSDTFIVETTKPLQINDAVQGNFLDYAYNFLVEETSQQEDLQTITGMYDVDLMLCTPIIYTIPTGAKASRHAQAIADALGKSAVIRVDDFVSTADFSSVGATYKNIISSLFGWTSSLPQRQINVFLRGDRLYFIQRGKENERIEITEPHSRPVIRRKIIRSMWASAAGNDIGTYAQSVIISPAPFSGTISFGDQSASYAGGLLMSESHGNEVTTYSYSGGAVSSKKRTSPQSTSETHYSYANTGNDRILATETETTMDLTVDPPTKSVKITRHVAIGHGFYGTTVEVDGEYKGASMGSGKPGGKASIFSINEANRSMGSAYSISDGKKLPGSSLIDTNFPVSGADTLRDLTDAIEWLNGKIEERVSMEVYNMDKVLDFTQKIIFQGNTYYLERNQLYKDPRVNKQSIELVRWY